MPQPPSQTRLRHVLDRARVLHGEDVAEAMAESFLADWEAAADEGPHVQALHCAVVDLVAGFVVTQPAGVCALTVTAAPLASGTRGDYALGA